MFDLFFNTYDVKVQIILALQDGILNINYLEDNGYEYTYKYEVDITDDANSDIYRDYIKDMYILCVKIFENPTQFKPIKTSGKLEFNINGEILSLKLNGSFDHLKNNVSEIISNLENALAIYKYQENFIACRTYTKF